MGWAGCSARCYAPSTLGSFLRAFRFGHVRQLDAVAARVTANLARAAPLLPGADQVAYVDVDDTVRQTYGYAKQGAGYGYTGVKGLNALLATVSTPLAAPIIVASRLRKGSAGSGRGARSAGRRRAEDHHGVRRHRAGDRPGGFGVLCRRGGRRDPPRPGLLLDHRPQRPGGRAGDRLHPRARRGRRSATHAPSSTSSSGQWISDAEVAEVPFTAFTSKPEARQVTGRLIVRRVRDANPDHVITNEQGELFRVWRL